MSHNKLPRRDLDTDEYQSQVHPELKHIPTNQIPSENSQAPGSETESYVKNDIDNTQSIDILRKQLEEPLPPTLFWHKVTFFFLGIASLAGWNAILTTLEFFEHKFPTQYFLKAGFYFPIPIMITNFLAGLACPALARIFSYNQRIACCLMGVCFTMFCVMLIAIYFNTQEGYWISIFILFVQGFIDSVNTNSLIALAGMITPQINRLYWTCTALSGLSMNGIRVIVLSIFNDNPRTENLCETIYFSAAAAIYLCSSALQILFTRSPFFLEIQRREEILKQLTALESNQKVIPFSSDCRNNSEVKYEPHISLKQQPFVRYMIYLSQVFKYAGAIPVYLTVIYIQTFMMFPGVSVFSKDDYKIVRGAWSSVFLITMFNFGDLIGKYLGGIKWMQRLNLTYGLIYARFIQFAFFLFTAKKSGGSFFQEDIFIWFNMLVFAISNGFCTTSLMVLGVRKAKDPEIINLINFIGGFSITFGITIGTFLALPFKQDN